jgi:hypothetical protein
MLKKEGHFKSKKPKSLKPERKSSMSRSRKLQTSEMGISGEAQDFLEHHRANDRSIPQMTEMRAVTTILTKKRKRANLVQKTILYLQLIIIPTGNSVKDLRLERRIQTKTKQGYCGHLLHQISP